MQTPLFAKFPGACPRPPSPIHIYWLSRSTKFPTDANQPSRHQSQSASTGPANSLLNGQQKNEVRFTSIWSCSAHFPIIILLQGPVKLTGVKQMECCCDPIRIINALSCIQRQQLTDNGLSKTTRAMTMNLWCSADWADSLVFFFPCVM